MQCKCKCTKGTARLRKTHSNLMTNCQVFISSVLLQSALLWQHNHLQRCATDKVYSPAHHCWHPFIFYIFSKMSSDVNGNVPNFVRTSLARLHLYRISWYWAKNRAKLRQQRRENQQSSWRRTKMEPLKSTDLHRTVHTYADKQVGEKLMCMNIA